MTGIFSTTTDESKNTTDIARQYLSWEMWVHGLTASIAALLRHQSADGSCKQHTARRFLQAAYRETALQAAHRKTAFHSIITDLRLFISQNEIHFDGSLFRNLYFLSRKLIVSVAKSSSL
jgi:hypothetical protein